MFNVQGENQILIVNINFLKNGVNWNNYSLHIYSI